MKIVQISDFHLYKDPTQRLFGLVNTNDTLLDVLEVVKKEKTDLVIASGDLSDDGSKESYQRLKSYLNNLDCDIYAIHGNHDNPDNFNHYLIGGNIKNSKVFKSDFFTLIFIDSYKHGFSSGFITDDNFVELESNLKENDNCILVIHHHFFALKNIEPKTDNILDRYILENGQRLIQMINCYQSKIKFCITGHVHNFYQYQVNNVKIYCCPSTCVQYARKSELLLEATNPSFLVYNFMADGYEVTRKTI